MTMKIKSQKELRVWQEAMDAAMEIFRSTKSFPDTEKFSLTDQIRRSSRSVATNLSEAWRKRRYAAAFVSKLNDSEGEAAETQTSIELARRCGYWSDEQASTLDARYERILGQLVNMINHPEQWVLRQGDKATGRQGESPHIPPSPSLPVADPIPSSPRRPVTKS
jgi:four helix bundle protein